MIRLSCGSNIVWLPTGPLTCGRTCLCHRITNIRTNGISTYSSCLYFTLSPHFLHHRGNEIWIEWFCPRLETCDSTEGWVRGHEEATSRGEAHSNRLTRDRREGCNICRWRTIAGMRRDRYPLDTRTAPELALRESSVSSAIDSSNPHDGDDSMGRLDCSDDYVLLRS